MTSSGPGTCSSPKAATKSASGCGGSRRRTVVDAVDTVATADGKEES